MPRWTATVAPFSMPINKYLPRRSRARIVPALTHRAKAALGIGNRSFRLAQTMRTTFRPIRCGTKPRRITSTSGNSGICLPFLKPGRKSSKVSDNNIFILVLLKLSINWMAFGVRPVMFLTMLIIVKQEAWFFSR